VGRKSVVFQTLYFVFLEEFLACGCGGFDFGFGWGVFVCMLATKFLFFTE
jgi:hypothetical protein